MRRRIILSVGGVVALLLALSAIFIRFNVKGEFKGLFLLREGDGASLELKDDIYLGEAHRLVAGIDLDSPRRRLKRLFGHEHRLPYLSYEWNAQEGKGYVRNHLADGRELLTCLSRFKLDGQQECRGLFVGGGLPAEAATEDERKLNKTGMTYFDGHRWYHIWCNVNEAVKSERTTENYYPWQWKFLGSKVVSASEQEVTLASEHEIVVDGVPLHMERLARFRAGDPFFIFSFRIENVGNRNAHYVYYYGDEPWLGNYGTSGGNVGWVKDGLVRQVNLIDTRKYGYAGFFDCGNDLLGEGHRFTGLANFLEWESPLYTTVFFSNDPNQDITGRTGKEPLQGDARTITVQWGPSSLAPGQADFYLLAVGMAGRDPKTGLPVKPETFSTLQAKTASAP